MNTTFSVITICLNEERRIDRTLRSAIAQTFPGVEIIVVDGASVDGTLRRVEKYKHRIARLISEPDEGIYDAMNKGAACARGDYIIFMNSGDFFYADTVLQEVFDHRLDADIVFGYVVNDQGVARKKMDGLDFDPRTYLERRTLPHQATFIRRSLFQRLGGFDKSLRIVADYELLLRAMRLYSASFRYLPVCISVYDETGVSATAIEAWKSEKQRVQDAWLKCAPESPQKPPRGWVGRLKQRLGQMVSTRGRR